MGMFTKESGKMVSRTGTAYANGHVYDGEWEHGKTKEGFYRMIGSGSLLDVRGEGTSMLRSHPAPSP